MRADTGQRQHRHRHAELVDRCRLLVEGDCRRAVLAREHSERTVATAISGSVGTRIIAEQGTATPEPQPMNRTDMGMRSANSAPRPADTRAPAPKQAISMPTASTPQCRSRQDREARIEWPGKGKSRQRADKNSSPGGDSPVTFGSRHRTCARAERTPVGGARSSPLVTHCTQSRDTTHPAQTTSNAVDRCPRATSSAPNGEPMIGANRATMVRTELARSSWRVDIIRGSRVP